ncbi:MAG: hypothetical protein B6D72_07375 [gamma proteobacterium symbiont of Ctena orbiculata]|nr:MAG: hypothetical protein B6D72_07375 [gamma proteobacterium symbiont of Ctena orbiculata]PVV26200.1 MAG: hypothetical protein B6D74_01770 [gamma proteobacterium symbiont of Ctena orbiculata]
MKLKKCGIIPPFQGEEGTTLTHNSLQSGINGYAGYRAIIRHSNTGFEQQTSHHQEPTQERYMEAVRYITLALLLITSTSAFCTNSLLDSLTGQLGITSEQAAGGAGALFNLAKSRLPSEEFSQIAAVVPEVDKLIADAPALAESSGGAAAVANLLGGEGSIAGIASLANAFNELGLSADMIGNFTPIILEYLQQAGGNSVMEIMKGALMP